MVAVFTATTPRPGGLSCLLIVSPLSGRALTTMMTNLSMAPSLMSLRMNPLVRRQAASPPQAVTAARGRRRTRVSGRVRKTMEPTRPRASGTPPQSLTSP